MSSSGAIPKVKGGARPKTKVISNGDYGNKNNNKSNRLMPNAKPIETSHITDEKFKLSREVQPKNRISLSNNFKEEQSVESFPDINVGNSKPLDVREILITDEGVEYKRKALSQDWVEKRIFIHYTRPPICNLEGDYVVGAVEAWVEQMEFLVGDLSWLLCLSHHRFWSQIVYDKSAEECLHYYLMYGPRWYDKMPEDESCLAVINSIHQLTFLVYVRMATYKESKEDHITPSVFGDLIYNNFLYDICKVLDLCVFYGSLNRPLMERIVNNIFTHQPKYFQDLSELALSLFSVLKNLEEKLGIADATVPSFLSGPEVTLELDELKDVLKYMLDSFYSLYMFLSIFPKACETFHQKDFEIRLSSFYERVLPKLTELLSPDEGESEDEVLVKRELQQTLNTVRMSILSIFRQILCRICLKDDKPSSTELPSDRNESSSTETLSRRIESFAHILTSAVEDKMFMTDYNASFDVSKDILRFQKEGADLTTLNFVKEAVDSIVREMNSQIEVVQQETPKTKMDGNDPSGMNGYYAGETCSLSPVEIESLATGVQDLFPELGSGFIKECLKYYNYSSEEVLNGILEGNLPPYLDSLDRTMKEPLAEVSVLPDEGESSPQERLNNSRENLSSMVDESSVLVNRLNIYDDDEFDVFRKPTTQLKTSHIHRGKAERKEYEKDTQLNEKVKKIIHEYEYNQGYSIYDDEEKYTTIASTEYDDEYDDTYADNEAGDVDTFGGDTRNVDGIPTIWGRGALNTRAMNFNEDEEEEESGETGRDGGRREEQKGGFGRGVERRLPENQRADLANQSKWENSDRKPEKFKKANATQRRVYADREQEWDSSSTMSFTNSRRGASWRGGAINGGEETPGDEESNTQRPAFEPFCENPEETRMRMDRRRQNRQFRNKGYVYPSSSNCNDDSSGSGFAPSQGSGYGPPPSHGGPPPPSYQRTSTKTNKHSGKSWRQGNADGGDDGEGRKPQGGKYKEDTNHGKAQDRNHRYKMMHKNEQKRNAAQAKYRSNF